MRTWLGVLTVAAFLSATDSAHIPDVLTVRSTHLHPGSNGYIVKLKEPYIDHVTHASWLNRLVDPDSASSIRHKYSSRVFHGYSGIFSSTTLAALRASSDVEYIVKDVIGGADIIGSQSNAPWGLQRLAQSKPLPPASNDMALNFSFAYDTSAGAGVDVYIIDTGIMTSHVDFGGRASFGTAIAGSSNYDGTGHGTHVAGTCVGAQFGVAKSANVIAVKVVDDYGVGLASDFIAGVEWALNRTRVTGRPSVLSASLHYPANIAIDDVVTAAVNAGVTFIASAGNDNVDASSQSPGRASAVITVGATNITDVRASFSNFGAGVDLFAPGVDTVSASISSNTASTVKSGTSMSAPHVAGLAAYILGLPGNSRMTPDQVFQTMMQWGRGGILSRIPAGTANLIAGINVTLLR